MAQPLKIVIAGASGRMGRMLVKAAAQTRDLKLVAALDGPHSDFLGEDAGVLAGIGANGILLQAHFPTEPFDALIDFTTPLATKIYLEHSSKLGLIHVIGTTGFSAADLAFIQEKAKTCCVIRSGNMSLGVNLLAALVKKAAQSLDPSFDIEIVEMHHRMKIDAPSGTAYLLGEAAAEGRQIAERVDLRQTRCRRARPHPLRRERPEGSLAGIGARRDQGQEWNHRPKIVDGKKRRDHGQCHPGERQRIVPNALARAVGIASPQDHPDRGDAEGHGVHV